jgi:hypothetical protein
MLDLESCELMRDPLYTYNRVFRRVLDQPAGATSGGAEPHSGLGRDFE